MFNDKVVWNFSDLELNDLKVIQKCIRTLDNYGIKLDKDIYKELDAEILKRNTSIGIPIIK